MLGKMTIGAFTWNINSSNDCGMIKRWVGFPEIRIMNRSRNSEME